MLQTQIKLCNDVINYIYLKKYQTADAWGQ